LALAAAIFLAATRTADAGPRGGFRLRLRPVDTMAVMVSALRSRQWYWRRGRGGSLGA
jgi:hypothetical protein